MLSLLLPLSAAFTAETLPRGVVAPRAAVTRMFEEAPKTGPESAINADLTLTTVTRSREAGQGRRCAPGSGHMPF